MNDDFWLVCHTQPRCEKKFAAQMASARFEHYLPLVQSVKRYARQIKRFTKPLFPGYVFAKVPRQEKAFVFRRDLVVRTIIVTDESTFLRQLTDLKTVVAAGLPLTVVPALKKGVRVRIKNGPLYGLEGLVDDAARPEEVVIAVDILQQGLRFSLPVENLEVLA